MAVKTRVARAEQQIAAVALAYVQRTYGLTAVDLAAIARFKAILSEPYFDHEIAALMDTLTADFAQTALDANYEAERHTNMASKLRKLQALAGLDRHKAYEAQLRAVEGFEIPAVVTLDTLLDLERQICQQWAELSTVVEYTTGVPVESETKTDG